MKTLSNFALVSKPSYRREVIGADRGGQVALDFYEPTIHPPAGEKGAKQPAKHSAPPVRADRGEKKRPLVVIVPGFGTDSHYQYIYGAAMSVYNTLGWDVCVFNQKGMGRVPFTGSDLLGYWSSKDLEYVLTHLAKDHSDIHLLGFSVGANLIQNFLTDLWDCRREQTALSQAAAQGLTSPIFTPRPYTRDVTNTALLDSIVSTVSISPIYHFQTTCNIISAKAWINPVLNLKLFNCIEANLPYEDFKRAMKEHDLSLEGLKKLKTFTELNQTVIQACLREPDPQKAFDLISPWQHLDQVHTKMLCISSLDDIIVE